MGLYMKGLKGPPNMLFMSMSPIRGLKDEEEEDEEAGGSMEEEEELAEALEALEGFFLSASLFLQRPPLDWPLPPRPSCFFFGAASLLSPMKSSKPYEPPREGNRPRLAREAAYMGLEREGEKGGMNELPASPPPDAAAAMKEARLL